MRFQCKILGRKTIYLNSKLLQLDSQGILSTEDAEDIRVLQAMPDEWTTSITQRASQSPLEPAAPAKGASEFLTAYTNDDDFRGRVDTFRSAVTRRNFVESCGYRFSDAELAAETAKRAAAQERDAKDPVDAEIRAAAGEDPAPVAPVSGIPETIAPAPTIHARAVPPAPAAQHTATNKQPARKGVKAGK